MRYIYSWCAEVASSTFIHYNTTHPTSSVPLPRSSSPIQFYLPSCLPQSELCLAGRHNVIIVIHAVRIHRLHCTASVCQSCASVNRAIKTYHPLPPLCTVHYSPSAFVLVVPRIIVARISFSAGGVGSLFALSRVTIPLVLLNFLPITNILPPLIRGLSGCLWGSAAQGCLSNLMHMHFFIIRPKSGA